MNKSIQHGIIYKATNLVNGKVYIGQTIHSLHNRKLAHIEDSRKGSNFLFHRAIRKHGEKSFKWEIIDEADIERNNETLNLKEIYWIAYYNSFLDRASGYNMQPGGNYLVTTGTHNGMYGKSHNEATLKKMSLVKLRQPAPDIQDIIYYYFEGEDAIKIASHFKISSPYINRALKRCKIYTGNCPSKRFKFIMQNYYKYIDYFPKNGLDLIKNGIMTRNKFSVYNIHYIVNSFFQCKTIKDTIKEYQPINSERLEYGLLKTIHNSLGFPKRGQSKRLPLECSIFIENNRNNISYFIDNFNVFRVQYQDKMWKERYSSFWKTEKSALKELNYI